MTMMTVLGVMLLTLLGCVVAVAVVLTAAIVWAAIFTGRRLPAFTDDPAKIATDHRVRTHGKLNPELQEKWNHVFDDAPTVKRPS